MRAVTASRILAHSCAVAVSTCSAAAFAQQNFPTKPVRYVVPFPGGSGNDMVGRLVTDQLSKMWKQQVVVDNRGGASGTIGAAMVAKAPPDGHTLLHCNIAPNAISLTMMRLSYKHEDFAPITRIGMPPNVIMVHPSTPFRSIKDLVAYAKAHPGKLSYAAGLVGTSPHLSMEWLKQRMRFEIVHVPFVNPSQAMGQVVGGELPIYITNMPLVIGPIQGGRLRALAVASAQRQALLPNVPTMQESGVPDFEVNSWYGVCAPAGVPEALLDRLNADVHTAMRVPEVEHRLTELGMPPAPTTRQEFDAFMRKEIARWAQVIRDAKIPMQ